VSKWTDNQNPDEPPPVPPKTIFLAQVGWNEPNEAEAKRYPRGIDVCKTIKTNDPEELREEIQRLRFLYGSNERFNVCAWSETLKFSDGHWKLDEKHDLAVRA
jgi:hypothetical protein